MKIMIPIILLLLFFLFLPSCKAVKDLMGLTDKELPTTIKLSITPDGGDITLPSTYGLLLAKLEIDLRVMINYLIK